MLYGRIKRSPHAHARIVRDRCVEGARSTRRPLRADARGRAPRAVLHGRAELPGAVSLRRRHARHEGPLRGRPRGRRRRRDAAARRGRRATSSRSSTRCCRPFSIPRAPWTRARPSSTTSADATGIEDAARNLAARIDVDGGRRRRRPSPPPAHVFEHELRRPVRPGDADRAAHHDDLPGREGPARRRDEHAGAVPREAHRRARERPAHLRVRVIKPRIGGAFGAKQEVVLEDVCAALTLRTRRPVKLMLDRDEELYAQPDAAPADASA